jgi:cysteine desulfurase
MSGQGYFDYNATTPICDEARRAVLAALDCHANPSSKYSIASPAKAVVAKGRRQLAALLSVAPETIVITSGGTESNNWGIKGALIARGLLRRDAPPCHVVVSAIEHASIHAVVDYLAREHGVEVTRVAPDRRGIVSVSSILAALRPHTALVSLMHINNETGAIQPVADLAESLRSKGIHFHVDGVQSVGKVPVDATNLGVDTLSFSAHKFMGPKGIGGLYVRPGTIIEPMIHGGGQESGQRGGTEAVPFIAGMGAAAEAIQAILPEMVFRMREYRSLLLKQLTATIPGIEVNGPEDELLTAPNTLNICIKGIRAEAVAALLDLSHGIQVSLGSACSSNKAFSYSHVLQAMGLSEAAIKASMRISLGRYTSEESLDQFAKAMANSVAAIKKTNSEVINEASTAN